MKFKPATRPGGMVVELGQKEGALPAENAPGPGLFRMKRILVPTDFSECSLKAIRYAASFARQFEAEITLLYVVQPYYPVPQMGALDYAIPETDLTQNAARELQALAGREIPSDIKVQTLVRVGNAAHEIAGAARTVGANLILLSTHGHTGLKHVFMGSTTEHVVRYAPAPVLVVREHETEFLLEPSS